MKTEKKLTNIKLTESDIDGIWLHFEGGGLKAGISIQVLSAIQPGGIAAATIQNWAREQLDKQEVTHRRFCITPQNEMVIPGTRSSPPVEGGY